MDLSSFAVQILNSIQYGFLLFLLSAGLTLVFGVMGVINLAHGSFFMVGAYLAYSLHQRTGSLFTAIAIGLPVAAAAGYLVERLFIRLLYARGHLQQVLLTYGLILVFNEGQRMIWGNDVHGVPVPPSMSASIRLTSAEAYPVYRLVISAACIAVAAAMAVILRRTRLGMMIRAGRSDRAMASALGIDVGRVFAIVFSAGAALAALAGMLSAPVSAVYPGMGEEMLILSFVVVVIGGIGSIKGALAGAMLIGFADTFGKVLLPGLAGVTVYAVMAAVLLFRPEGLFGRSAR